MSANTAKQRYEQLGEWMKTIESISKTMQNRKKRFSKGRAYKNAK